MTAYESILERRSVRSYKSEQIKDSELEAVLKAGIFAPTAMNKQSPKIVAVQNADDIALMSRLNASVMGGSGDPFYGAPTVIVVFADGENKNGVQDASLVMGNLMNGAFALGLGSCWINRAKEVFELPEGKELMKKWGVDEKYVGVGNCIVGYAAETPAPKPRREGYCIIVK